MRRFGVLLVLAQGLAAHGGPVSIRAQGQIGTMSSKRGLQEPGRKCLILVNNLVWYHKLQN